MGGNMKASRDHITLGRGTQFSYERSLPYLSLDSKQTMWLRIFLLAPVCFRISSGSPIALQADYDFNDPSNNATMIPKVHNVRHVSARSISGVDGFNSEVRYYIHCLGNSKSPMAETVRKLKTEVNDIPVLWIQNNLKVAGPSPRCCQKMQGWPVIA